MADPDPAHGPRIRTPTVLPVLGALSCGFLAGPWTGRDPVQYEIAGILIGIGIVLWGVTVLVNRATGVTGEPRAVGASKS
jgi:basic amino acid/polyamine antiporter, APA family